MPRKSLLRSKVLLTACAALTLDAAPPLSVIQDVLYRADGTRFDGVAEISWSSFRAVDGSEVPQHTLLLKILNGQLKASVVPTTNAQTTAYYVVKFSSSGKTQFTEYWAVPSSSTPLKLKDVRTASPILGAITTPVSVVGINEVLGLRTELEGRPAKGVGFSPGRAIYVSPTGQLESVVGSTSDCVRVDGTSGPCGAGGGPVTFVDNEVPSGAIDGVNTQFTVSSVPYPASSLKVYRNGLLLKAGVDYSLSASTITFMSAAIAPKSGDILQVSYRQ